MQEESNTADKMVVQDKRSIYYVRYPNLAIYCCLTMASGHYLPILYHIMWALQAKVQRLENELRKELDEKEDMHKLVRQVQSLENALRTEEERMEHLVESKVRYKGRVTELTGKQAEALDRIKELEAVVEEGESDWLELQRELEEAQASGGTELEMLKPVVEEYSRERTDYMEWKMTGTCRMELARGLAGVEED